MYTALGFAPTLRGWGSVVGIGTYAYRLDTVRLVR
jgi:hypothetical protein